MRALSFDSGMQRISALRRPAIVAAGARALKKRVSEHRRLDPAVSTLLSGEDATCYQVNKLLSPSPASW